MPSKYRLTVNLAPHEYKLLAALSDASRLSRAWLIRQAVSEFLERHEDEQVQLPLGILQKSSRSELP
jgi:predicted transcriptional regulator